MTARAGLAVAFAISLSAHLALAGLLEARPDDGRAAIRTITLRIPGPGEGIERPGVSTASEATASAAAPNPAPNPPQSTTTSASTDPTPDPAPNPQPSAVTSVPTDPVQEERASIPQPPAIPPVPAPKPAATSAPVETHLPPRQTSPSEASLLPSRATPPVEAGGQEAALSYQQEVRREINRHKRYPPAAFNYGLEGTVLIELTLARNGSHLDSAVIRSSGSAILDRAAERTARAGEYRAAPASLPGERFTFRIPLTYSIR